MDISLFADKLKEGKEEASSLRLIFQCVKSPQFGTGVRFNYDNGVTAEYVYLCTLSGDKITDKTLSRDIKVITNVSEMPEPFIVSMGAAIQKVNHFLDGSFADINLLAASNATVKGFMFNK